MVKMKWIAQFTVPQSFIDEHGAKMSAAWFATLMRPYVDEIISADINRRLPDVPQVWFDLHSLSNTYEFQSIDEVEFVADE